MPESNKHSARFGGYTLIEVLIVVTILGIAAAVIVPHMLSAGTFGVQAAARVIISDMLYAQNEAITRQRPIRVVFDPANERYSLIDDLGNVLSVNWKRGETNNYVTDFVEDKRFRGVLIESASFGVTNPPTLEFDALGGPTDGGNVVISFRDARYQITVAAFTGRVTVIELP